ncbi:carbonate dehydratase, eukaryotic-type [Ancylostoma ceylanicum]|uniref:carbonic anhydrase n=1 Tax=Ancylostoma ceylanicum TaxID=53326 RepID=A0A0D6LXX9_9BILA|nr:carbonate dehydratase, eukaryotic-type [Ancylostoma ceylanicum]
MSLDYLYNLQVQQFAQQLYATNLLIPQIQPLNEVWQYYNPHARYNRLNVAYENMVHHAVQKVFLCLASGKGSEEWGYVDKSAWKKTCKTGKSQSPIDLDISQAILVDWEPLKFHNYDARGDIVAENNGHTELVQGFQSWTKRPYVTDTKGDVPSYSPGSLLPPDTSTFFRYTGSLTTPPCSEGVIWTILAYPNLVTDTQLRILRRHLKEDGSLLIDNWRTVQPMNGRKLYLNKGTV